MITDGASLISWAEMELRDFMVTYGAPCFMVTDEAPGFNGNLWSCGISLTQMDLRNFKVKDGTQGFYGHLWGFRAFMVTDGAQGYHGTLASFWDIMVAGGAAGI